MHTTDLGLNWVFYISKIVIGKATDMFPLGDKN